AGCDQYCRGGVIGPRLRGGDSGEDHRGLVILVLEAQSRRRSGVVVLEKAVRQSALELRAHEGDVNIPLRCKLPIGQTTDRVQRTGVALPKSFSTTAVSV